MAKRKKTARGQVSGREVAPSQNNAIAAVRSLAADSLLIVEKPVWNELTGHLSWKGSIMLTLAKHAHSERAILSAFEGLDWRWIVADPLCRATIGDPTQERRHAICNLKKHQRPRELIRFFSINGGFVGWCDADWVTVDR